MPEKTILSSGESSNPGADGTSGRGAERRTEGELLGRAIRARTGDVVRICQGKYLEQAESIGHEAIVSDPMWSITSVAVTAVADWLETGSRAGEREREQIASLGNIAAKQRARPMRSPPIRNVASPEQRASSDASPDSLSVTLLTKLNLWWRDATNRVLVEEASRLAISTATLQSAMGMVSASCDSSLVRMAKGYDAELQELHERLSYLALHDPLTGLANRATLLSQLDRALSRLERHPTGLAIAFIDLDNFKAINDFLGHGCGDQVISAMAVLLASEVRPGDSIARFGGDEFVVLFEDLSEPLEQATELAERLCRASRQPIHVVGEPISMTASIGVAVVSGPNCRSEDVLARADATMYAVKHAGRDRVAVAEL